MNTRCKNVAYLDNFDNLHMTYDILQTRKNTAPIDFEKKLIFGTL